MIRHAHLFLLIILFYACNKPSDKENQQEDAQNTTIAPADSNTAFSDQFIDGQPIASYLKMPELPNIVRAYYSKELEISQNAETDSLMKILISPDENLTPFYYKCFMNICKESNATLSSYLGEKCISLLENNTFYCISKLKDGSPDYFTGLVANEIYQNEDWENEINNLSVRLHINLENEAPELRKELDLFIVGVKNDIEHMGN